jgi:hypothetical protein
MNAHLTTRSSPWLQGSGHRNANAAREGKLRKEREALLVAALAGLLIVTAAAFVIQPNLDAARLSSPNLLSNLVLQGTAFAPARSS